MILPKWSGVAGMALALFTVAVVFSYFLTSPKNPPAHELISSRVEPEIVKANPTGTVDIKVTTSSIRRMQCDVVIYRTIANADTNEVLYQTFQKGGLVPATGKLTEFPMVIRLPGNRFPAGQYLYSAFAINKCADERIVIATTGVARFAVE